MKNKISQIIFTFITGASLAHVGDPVSEPVPSQHSLLVDAPPRAEIQKLSPSQLKEVLDLKLSGFEAYILTLKNPSQRSYSLSLASLQAEVISYEEGASILAKKPHTAVSVSASIVGHFVWPVGIAGQIFSFIKLKSAKIFQGKLKAMLLDKEVMSSYSQLSRVILVKSGTQLDSLKIDLIDMQTLTCKQIALG
jgi:hypothetical protein